MRRIDAGVDEWREASAAGPPVPIAARAAALLVEQRAGAFLAAAGEDVALRRRLARNGTPKTNGT